MPKRHCGRCHTCGTRLIPVLDGEEYCPKCDAYRRYRSHGWAAGVGENSPCGKLQQPEFNLLFDSTEDD